MARQRVATTLILVVVMVAAAPGLAQTQAPPHLDGSSWRDSQTQLAQAGPEKRDVSSQLEDGGERKGVVGFRGKKMQQQPALFSAYGSRLGYWSPLGRSLLEDEDFAKRAPSGFFGMRGKKAPSGFLGMRGKKAPSGFLGMRGKKDDGAFLDNEMDRTGSSEMMPWSQDVANWLSQLRQASYESLGSAGDNVVDPADEQSLHYLLEDKRAPSGFLGMRGKRYAQLVPGYTRLFPVAAKQPNGEDRA